VCACVQAARSLAAISDVIDTSVLEAAVEVAFTQQAFTMPVGNRGLARGEEMAVSGVGKVGRVDSGFWMGDMIEWTAVPCS
jgi:hypothetical protein